MKRHPAFASLLRGRRQCDTTWLSSYDVLRTSPSPLPTLLLCHGKLSRSYYVPYYKPYYEPYYEPYYVPYPSLYAVMGSPLPHWLH